MMRRNLFISKVWTLSFFSQRKEHSWVMVRGGGRGRGGVPRHTSASRKLLSAPIFCQERRIDKRRPGARVCPKPLLFSSLKRYFANMNVHEVPGNLYITTRRILPDIQGTWRNICEFSMLIDSSIEQQYLGRERKRYNLYLYFLHTG